MKHEKEGVNSTHLLALVKPFYKTVTLQLISFTGGDISSTIMIFLLIKMSPLPKYRASYLRDGLVTVND